MSYIEEYNLIQIQKNPNLHCGICQVIFQPKSWNTKYCSNKCKAKSVRQKAGKVKLRQKRVVDYHLNIKTNPSRLEAHRADGRKHKTKVREWLARYKLERGCIDCRFKEHSAALQLDHMGPKRAEIADLRSSVRRLMLEIESGNCVVRCANCHAIKTWREKQYAKKVA